MILVEMGDQTMGECSDTILKLVKYELWCNLQAIDFLAGLSEDESRRDFGFGLRTPHRTISHIADVMCGWSGCVGPTIKKPTWLPYDETVTLQQIRSKIVKVGESWMLAVKVSHERGLLGKERRLNQVFHLVTHGTHHRGQLLSMITLMGHGQPFEGGDFGGWSDTAAQQIGYESRSQAQTSPDPPKSSVTLEG
jgi:uncharacterized damage-inducible protein DinB